MTGRVQRVRTRIAATRTTRFVLVCVVAAVLLHFPGLLWPLRPDEAGFTLVGRHWDPEPESLYGPYWVDRPPPLILIYRLSDLVRSEEHTSELQSLMRISYAVFCLKKKHNNLNK